MNKHDIPTQSTGEIDDKKFAELIRRHTPHAPIDPWFTRKVLNRLDSKPRRIAALIERLLYIIGIATTLGVAIHMGIGIVGSTDAVTGQQATTLLILAALTAAMAYGLIEPLMIKSRIDDKY